MLNDQFSMDNAMINPAWVNNMLKSVQRLGCFHPLQLTSINSLVPFNNNIYIYIYIWIPFIKVIVCFC